MKRFTKYIIIAICLLGVSCGEENKSSAEIVTTTLYKSSITLIPIKKVKKNVMLETKFEKNKVEIGSMQEAKEMIEVLKNPQTRDSVNIEFNLFKRYEVKKFQDNNMNIFIEEFERNFLFEITQEGFVYIEVQDRSQDTATLIVNFIVDILDKELSERSKVEIDVNLKSNHEALQLEIQQLQDTILTLNTMGVVDKEFRTALNEALISAPKGKEQIYLLEKVEFNNKYGLIYDSFLKLREQKINELTQVVSVPNQNQHNSKNFLILEKSSFPSYNK